MRVPGGGASCLDVGRPGSGALPPPTTRPFWRVAGAQYPLAVDAGGVGVGTRHQPHSVVWGRHEGPGGGAPLAWVWGIRARALSQPQPFVVLGVRPGPASHWPWVRCAGVGARPSLAPSPVPRFVVCCAHFPGSRHPVAVVAGHLSSCCGCGQQRASLACPVAPRWCTSPHPFWSLSVLPSAFLSPWCLPPPRGLSPPALLGRCAGHVEAGREPGSLCLPLAPVEARSLGLLRVVPARVPAMGLSMAGPSSFGLGLHALRLFACVDPVTDASGLPYRPPFEGGLGRCTGAVSCGRRHLPLRVPRVCARVCSSWPGRAGRPPGCVSVRPPFPLTVLPFFFVWTPPGRACPWFGCLLFFSPCAPAAFGFPCFLALGALGLCALRFAPPPPPPVPFFLFPPSRPAVSCFRWFPALGALGLCALWLPPPPCSLPVFFLFFSSPFRVSLSQAFRCFRSWVPWTSALCGCPPPPCSLPSVVFLSFFLSSLVAFPPFFSRSRAVPCPALLFCAVLRRAWRRRALLCRVLSWCAASSGRRARSAVGVPPPPFCCPLVPLPDPPSWSVVSVLSRGAVLCCSVLPPAAWWLLFASVRARGVLLLPLRWLVSCAFACDCWVRVVGSGCLLLFSSGVFCRGCSCLAAWPAALLLLRCVAASRSPVLCPVFRGAVLPCGAVPLRPAVHFAWLAVLVCVLSACQQCCVVLCGSCCSAPVWSVLSLVPCAVARRCVWCCLPVRPVVWWCCPVARRGVPWCPAAPCCALWCRVVVWCRAVGLCGVFPFAGGGPFAFHRCLVCWCCVLRRSAPSAVFCGAVLPCGAVLAGCAVWLSGLLVVVFRFVLFCSATHPCCFSGPLKTFAKPKINLFLIAKLYTTQLTHAGRQHYQYHCADLRVPTRPRRWWSWLQGVDRFSPRAGRLS